MGNTCSSVKLYLEKKVAGSITKRTLAKDAKPSAQSKNFCRRLDVRPRRHICTQAKPITKDGQPEPPELAAIHDSWDALLANHLRPAGAPVEGVKFAALSYVELAAEDGFAALVESIAKVGAATVNRLPAHVAVQALAPRRDEGAHD